jgi:succinate dehydrogenase/fumarate reductase flavoprotein subunit
MNKLTVLLVVFLSFSLQAKEKEYMVIYNDNPWDTNEPYYDDYVKESDNLGDRLEVLAPKEFKNCQKIESDFSKSMCLFDIEKDIAKEWVLRGTIKYVMNNYASLRTEPKKLLKLLKSLDAIRNKTRKVNILLKSDRKKGELSYQMINAEICLIESNIGKLRSKSFCHERRY